MEDYAARVDTINVKGGAVVSGSFQQFDQTYLLDALAQLGPAFVGVTQVPADVEDGEVERLHAAGVRAVRFNVRRGGSTTLSDLGILARRVHSLVGWHSELYIDARDLPDLLPTLLTLPAISIDHLGLHADGLPHLLRLVENGAMVKATGFGRVDLNPATVIAAIMDTNPTSLMVGTDLPSTRARRPFRDEDLAIVEDTVESSYRQAVFWDNAATFYGVLGPQG